MPTLTSERLMGFAFCEDSLCAGNRQEPVEIIRTEAAYTFKELGGDLPGFERSTESFAFANPDDAPCGVCAGQREAEGLEARPRAVSSQKRPVYPSQYNPRYLTMLQTGQVKPVDEREIQGQSGGGDAAMQAQIAQLQAELIAMRAAQSQSPAPITIDVEAPVVADVVELETPKRGPGRPRKDPDA